MSRFDVTYPPKGEITFDGGSNFKYSRALIPENTSPSNLNVTTNGDSVETRGGTQKLNTAAAGSFACDGLFTRHSTDGTESMVAWFGGHFMQLSGTTFNTVPSGQSLWTAGSKVYATEYENHLFMGNGNSIPMKWNGTYLTRHGVYPPSSAPSYSSLGASGTSAISNGTYYYKVTYVNSFTVEGNPSSASIAISAACQTVNLIVPVAATSFGVAARRIYRASGPSATYQRIAEIADNTTAAYADNFDQTVGANAPSDNGVPPLYSAIIVHQNRLFANDPSNPNFVWYSGLGEPYTWSALDFQFLGDATADLVRGFQVQDNSLMVVCDKSAVAIYMPSTDDSTWQVIVTKSAYGTRSPGAIFRYKNNIAFPALENFQFVGFAGLSGTQPSTSQTLLTASAIESDLISDAIEPDMLLVAETNTPRIWAVVFEGKAYISLAYGANQTTNNRIYVFDFNREAKGQDDVAEESWFPWTYASLSPGPMTIYNNNVYFGSDTATGFVYKINHSTFSDDGSAINSFYATKEFSGLPQDINTTKDFRRFEFLFERLGNYYMNVGYRTDSSSGDFLLQPVDISPGGSLWGTMVYGSSEWSAGYQEGEQTIFVPAARGKRIQFLFSNQNTAGQGFRIIRMKYSYNNKGKR